MRRHLKTADSGSPLNEHLTSSNHATVVRMAAPQAASL